MAGKECKQCGQEMTLKRKWQKFCSPKCRFRNWDKENPRIKKSPK